MKKNMFLFFATILIVFLVGCGTNSKTTKENDLSKNEMNDWAVGTSSSNSSPYAIGGAVSKVINENQSVLKLSPQVTGGYNENTALVNQKEIVTGLNSLSTMNDAFNGTGDFKEKDFSNLRVLFNVAFLPTHIIVLESSGINDAQDLVGKKFSIAQPSQATRTLALDYLEANGLSVDEIKAQELSTSEALTALKNKQIDGAVIASPLPMGGIIELATTHDIKILPIEGLKAEKLIELSGNSMVKSEIPANTYPGIDYSVSTVASPSLIFTHKDADESIVYELTKAFWENIDDYYEQFPGGKTLNLENALEGISIPIHPGVEKYFQEQQE